MFGLLYRCLHTLQCHSTGTETSIRLTQCQWWNPEQLGSYTKHKTVCIFHGILLSVSRIILASNSMTLIFQRIFEMTAVISGRHPWNEVWAGSGNYVWHFVFQFTYISIRRQPLQISLLTHWGRDKMAATFQTSSNAFLSMKIVVFWLKFHWIMFATVQFTIIQHCFRQWLGAEQATSHCLNQWWPSLVTHICVSRPQWVNVLHQRFLIQHIQSVHLTSNTKSVYTYGSILCRTLSQSQQTIYLLNRISNETDKKSTIQERYEKW